MHVVLLHDARELPHDLYAALTAEGHRVAAHGTEYPAIRVFLEAIRVRPEAFVVDFRGRESHAREVAAWLREAKPWRDVPMVVAFVPEAMKDLIRGDLREAVAAASIDDVTEILAG